ncbi:MAG TPA: DNA methyltransferase [Pyrinomonadaceae bacterium]|nr:DNA methyltransferase [Pyrinomonadaceae bacterium]
MPAVKSIEETVSSINWDFPGALSNYGLHRFHWYPGTFIPQIPAYLIELFSQPGDTVYDPFCGVGTTLVEALRLGRRAIGVDQNFIATHVAAAKTTFFEAAAIDYYCKAFFESLQVELHNNGLVKDFSLPVLRATTELENARLEFQAVSSWYDERTFKELLLLWLIIQKEEAPFRTLLEVTFSSILKRCSSQPKHWGYVADNMVPASETRYYVDAIKLFTGTLKEFVAALIRFIDFPQIRGLAIAELNHRARVLHADLAIAPPVESCSVDLIVTSPPYVSVTDYTRSQRLSLPWFKQEVDQAKLNEVGARWKRARQGAVQDYLREMDVCFENLTISLKPGKFLCLVVGESKERKAKYEIVEALRSMIIAKGFKTALQPLVRIPSQQRLKNRKGNTNEEYIFVFLRA